MERVVRHAPADRGDRAVEVRNKRRDAWRIVVDDPQTGAVTEVEHAVCVVDAKALRAVFNSTSDAPDSTSMIETGKLGSSAPATTVARVTSNSATRRMKSCSRWPGRSRSLKRSPWR